MFVVEKINAGHYTTNAPPNRPYKARILYSKKNQISEDHLPAYIETEKQYNKNYREYKKALIQYDTKCRELLEQFKQDLLEEFELTNHPKVDELYELASKYGSEYGLHEIYIVFKNFSILLK